MARWYNKDETTTTTAEKNFTCLHKLVQILSFLVVFVAGIVIGLVTTSNINRHFINNRQSFSSSFVPVRKSCDNSNVNEECFCGSLKGYLRTKNVSHSMSDEELLWRASLMPKKEEYPYKRVPKVAFMFLTRGPLPMLPLWEKFFDGQDPDLFSIYVHAPPKFDLNVSKDSPFYHREIPSQSVSWGSVKLSDAERRLLANALLDFSNERFVLLSESCIPVYNFRKVYKYLTDSTYSFVESYDDPSRYGRGRYSRHMLPYIKLYHWRKGSQWFEVNRELAVYIVGDTQYYTLFRKYCTPACYPDEHYIPTFLNMFHGSQNSNRTVTWVDWSLGGPHPAMYGEANITKDFIQSIRNNHTLCQYNSEMTSVCYLFARKFAPSALGPLLDLSSTVMEF